MTFQQITNVPPGLVLPRSSSRSESPYLRSASSSASSRGGPAASTASAERADAGGLKLTGGGSLLGKLTRMVVESALEGELDDHLGYEKNDLAGRRAVIPAMATGPITVLTGTGPVEISVPRDRDCNFEPKVVAKGSGS
jgi:putative transposase